MGIAINTLLFVRSDNEPEVKKPQGKKAHVTGGLVTLSYLQSLLRICRDCDLHITNPDLMAMVLETDVSRSR